MTQRVLLHVGAPKTGTSFVQDILFTHRDALRERGILYPAGRHDAHFLARARPHRAAVGRLEYEAVGAWDQLSAEVRQWPGTAIISHEIFGIASRVTWPVRWSRSARTPRSTSCSPPATWSARSPRSGRRTSSTAARRPTRSFLENLRDPERSAEVAQWFWGVQEVPDVLDRWGESVPREQVHLVTVPPTGLEPDAAVGAVRRAVRHRSDRVRPRRRRPTPRSAYRSRP